MVVRETVKFAFPPILLGVLAAWFGLTWLALLFFVLTGFVVCFFRDPERAAPASATAVVSPADGKVLSITDESLDGAKYLAAPRIQKGHQNGSGRRCPNRDCLHNAHSDNRLGKNLGPSLCRCQTDSQSRE